MKNMFRMLFKHKIILATLLITALLGTSCNIPRAQSGPTQVPQLVFPTFPPTVTPEILTATAGAAEAATNVPPSTALPTVIEAPTMTPGTAPQPQTGPAATSIPGGTRISFAPGATAYVAQGTLQPGTPQNFVVRAMQGQPLIVSVESANQDATFSVVGREDGKTLLDVARNLSSWQTILTSTQDYLITIYPGADAENFTLNVIIPARITFQAGTNSANLQGSTPSGLIVSYVLRASAGQQMDINLNSPDGNAVLGVYGYQDGQPYLRSATESTTFSMKLPTTEDYIIQVAPRAGQVASYSMKVTVK
jgi:hypothetical protein